MASYRVVERRGGRTAVFDQYARCVELFEPGTSPDEVAAVITARHAAGEYATDDLVRQRAFDPDSQVWSEVDWPRDE